MKMRNFLKSTGTALIILTLLLSCLHLGDGWLMRASARALRRELAQAAQHCFAIEGRYPPDLDYLARHYGIRTKNRRFTVEYLRPHASRAPEIIVRTNPGGALA